MFGSSYPPGFNGVFPWDEPQYCDVCFLNVEGDCECLECPECEVWGDKMCYTFFNPDGHSMELSSEQITSRLNGLQSQAMEYVYAMLEAAREEELMCDYLAIDTNHVM